MLAQQKSPSARSPSSLRGEAGAGHGGLALDVEPPIDEGTVLILELIPRSCGVDQELIRIQGNRICRVPAEGKHRVGNVFYFSDDRLRARVARFLDGLCHLG